MYNIYSAKASRDVAIKELLLLERHHLGIPNARCKECEMAHQMTASALMSEASRMSDGTEEDLKIANEIDNIDFNLPQREVQQTIRKIRKKIMSLQGINECDENICFVSKKEIQEDYVKETSLKEDYTWLLYILGGLVITYFIVSLNK